MLCTHSLQAWLNDLLYRLRHGADRWAVRCSAEEIRVYKNGRQQWLLAISDLTRIRAVAQHAVTHELNVLLLDTVQRQYRIDECFEGFEDACARLQEQMPFGVKDWQTQLNRGAAFTGRHLLLWERTPQIDGMH